MVPQVQDSSLNKQLELLSRQSMAIQWKIALFHLFSALTLRKNELPGNILNQVGDHVPQIIFLYLNLFSFGIEVLLRGLARGH